MQLLDRKILKIHNYIYANDGLSNSETLNEFLKLFYCKILDEQSENKLTHITDSDSIIENVNNLYEKLKIKLKDFISPNEKINLKKNLFVFPPKTKKK